MNEPHLSRMMGGNEVLQLLGYSVYLRVSINAICLPNFLNQYGKNMLTRKLY